MNNSAKPRPKVVAGTVGGAVSTILLWVLTGLVHLSVPAYVAAAVTVLVTAAAAYIVPEG